FEHDSGNVSRVHGFAFQRGQEQIETGVLRPVTIGKGDLDDVWILVDDPIFLSGNPSGLLRSESSPMKAPFGAHQAYFLTTAAANAVRPRQLKGTFGRLRAGGQEEHLVEVGGSYLD